MASNKLTADFLLKHYVQDQKSTVEIAEILNCYPEQIRRALKKFNIPVRTKAKASRNFYENGGINSRKGYEFSPEEKERASIIAKEYWLSDDSEDAREKISESSRTLWEQKSKDERQATISRLHQACREASKYGSKAQRRIAEVLNSKYGYKTQTGMTTIVGIGNLEVDIAIPREGIVIEVDGITHFEDVYSDNRYERAQEHDQKKNDILTGAGWSVIRVKLVCERYSNGSCLIVCDKLNKMMKEKSYNKKGITYVEME
jgi:very-short-patch-repair endonuclease